MRRVGPGPPFRCDRWAFSYGAGRGGLMPTGAGIGYAAGMSNYCRMWMPGGIYFFTVNLLARYRRLLADRIADLWTAFRAIKGAG